MMSHTFTAQAAIFVALLASQCAAQSEADVDATTRTYCPIVYTEPPTNCEAFPDTFLDFSKDDSDPTQTDLTILEDTIEALTVLQREYFNTDYNTWPSAIDWTAAVAQTVVTGTLTSLSRSLGSIDLGGLGDWKAKENFISSFYAEVVASYFGQDILGLRGQAYDDMLWVVLGWLEAIKFVSVHSSLHYPGELTGNATDSNSLRQLIEAIPWHGSSWICSFAHRARVFWNLALRGWGDRLCHGGMVWNPRLNPYKNAITNELWISASISMYHDFPGDNFTSPFLAAKGFPGRDPAHLAAAAEGYRWLMSVNMTNDQGLFVDGYHIDRRKPNNVECDIRDEMVYTYNQGVILTGQRGLWRVTGAVSYLEEGHNLVQSVINATGWSLKANAPIDDLESLRHKRLPRWHGLGRGGILEEQCDAIASCSQDGQTFKGIFMHHLVTFCEPLDPPVVKDTVTVDMTTFLRVKMAHGDACRSYSGWVRYNANAALQTRDSHGRFGMWWGAGLFHNELDSEDDDGIDRAAENMTDYRNRGTPLDGVWGYGDRWLPGSGGLGRVELADETDVLSSDSSQQVLNSHERPLVKGDKMASERTERKGHHHDPNHRGRGRTIETQIGGLALLRASWSMSQPS